MLIALRRQVRSAPGGDRGFTAVEIVVVAAVLAFLVSVALPAYLSVRNKAAIDEANSMAQEWRTFTYGCYLKDPTMGDCTSNAVVGFREKAGKYWDYSSGSAVYNVFAIFTASATTYAMGVSVSWPSTNAGLENGETYVVSIFLSGSGAGQGATRCLPNDC